jgi:starch synthase (maltosyl-transferring)
VPPRLVGPVADWSGLDAPDGKSWLVDQAADLGFNAVWFSPLSVATGVKKTQHGKTLTGSYYAVRDHGKLDPEFSCGDDARDREHLKHFCKTAAAKGLRVYADLVFNHLAADHPLVEQENKDIAGIRAAAHGHVNVLRGHKNRPIGVSWHEHGQHKTYHFKFRRNDDLTLAFGGPAEDLWTDAAQINYASPEARRFFIEGDATHKAYFKQVIDRHIDDGFTGFRCDAAYLIPPESWKELISYAHKRLPTVEFMAETLGGPLIDIHRMSEIKIKDAAGKERPGFDHGMLGFYWWNMRDDWLPRQENGRLQKMARFGGAGSPDTHDTEGTVSGDIRKAFNTAARCDEIVAAVTLRNYAVATLTCNSSYAQMGTEYCNEKQHGVFKGQVSPKDWDELVRDNKGAGNVLDISDRIRAINKLKDDLGIENCRAEFREHHPVQDGKLVKISCAFLDVDTGQKKADIVLLVNQKPEKGAVPVTEHHLLALETGGLSRLGAEPDVPPVVKDVLIYHTPITPAPRPTIVFNAKSDAATDILPPTIPPRPSAPPPPGL